MQIDFKRFLNKLNAKMNEKEQELKHSLRQSIYCSGRFIFNGNHIKCRAIRNSIEVCSIRIYDEAGNEMSDSSVWERGRSGSFSARLKLTNENGDERCARIEYGQFEILGYTSRNEEKEGSFQIEFNHPLSVSPL